MKNKSKHALYGTWALMNVRCVIPGSVGYQNYGGRGIAVCERWRNSFDAFVEDMGERPAGTTLDRIDPNGNYEPSNCRWATQEEQSKNKRNSRYIMLDGARYHISEVSEKYGINVRTLSYRYAQGWPKEKLLSTAGHYNNSESQKKAVIEHARLKKLQETCKRGHPLSGENLYVNANRRHCRECRRLHDQATRAT